MPAEVSVCASVASVMMYDEVTRHWIPAHCSSAPCECQVEILHNYQQYSFKIVARTLSSGELILTSSVERGMRYNEATINFHQWRDTKIVYGLHFLNNDEAKVFGDVMRTCIDSLNSGSRIDFINNIYDAKENIIPMSEEDIYEDFRDEEDDLYQDQLRMASKPLLEQNLNKLSSFRSSEPKTQDPYSQARQPPDYAVPNNIFMSTFANPTVPAPKMSPTLPSQTSVSQPQPPTLPSVNPTPSVTQSTIPPPPPPPLPSLSSSIPAPPPPPPMPAPTPSSSQPSIKVKSLSDSISSCKLSESSSSKTPTKTGGGMASMMEEMKNKLASRRKMSTDLDDPETDVKPKTPVKTSVIKDSPVKTKISSKSASALNKLEVISGNRGLELVKCVDKMSSGVTKLELETMKAEILSEIRAEIQRTKLDIIDIIKSELSSKQ